MDANLLALDYSTRQYSFNTAAERRLRKWYTAVNALDDDGNFVDEIGHIVSYTFQYVGTAGPFDLLDAETADLGHIGGVLFDPDAGDLREEIYDRIEGVGDGLLVIDSVRLKKNWRGHGLGPLMVGMVVETLGEGRCLAALQAAPTELRDPGGQVMDTISGGERAAAAAKLGALWSTLGFEFVSHNVWILDLAARTFDDRMATIRRTLGVE